MSLGEEWCVFTLVWVAWTWLLSCRCVYSVWSCPLVSEWWCHEIRGFQVSELLFKCFYSYPRSCLGWSRHITHTAVMVLSSPEKPSLQIYYVGKRRRLSQNASFVWKWRCQERQLQYTTSNKAVEETKQYKRSVTLHSHVVRLWKQWLLIITPVVSYIYCN